MATPSIPRSKHLETAYTQITGFNTHSIETIMSHRAADCTQHFLPASMPHAPMSNDAFRAFYAKLMPSFRGYTIHVRDVLEDRAKHRVMFWTELEAETDAGPFRPGVTLLFVDLSDDGEQILRVTEFVDSQYGKEFMGKLMAAKKGET